ncbi:MAG: glutamate 5-kinase [Xanthomonadales bacterium]|nr:glutamate 5-kinase [Xanthomonadales bacterium]
MLKQQENKRLVVKVGSQVLCNNSGALNLPVLASLAQQISALNAQGWQIVLVSSGAVASGAGVMRNEPGAHKLNQITNPVVRKQALAAAGQVRLVESWQKLFSQHGVAVAQILATKSDFQTRRHYLNMRSCIEALLDAGLVPIVNENDVVAVTELMFTDNDELAGLIAGMVHADCLFLLSTVAGVLTGQPGSIEADCIAEWNEAVHKVDDVVLKGTSALGRGGMHSKITTARKVAALGTEVVIADGKATAVLQSILDGKTIGTRFAPGSGVSPAKRWLASAQNQAVGSVVVNPGAEAALLDQSRLASLLPVGISRVNGPFESGDVIQIRNEADRVIGCGRCRYGADEASAWLGQRGHKPLIHYDYLFMLESIRH